MVGLHSPQGLDAPVGSSWSRETREWCAPGGSDLHRAPRRPYLICTLGARTLEPKRASHTPQRRFTRCFGRWHAAGGAGRPHASRGPPRRHGPWSQVAHVPIPPGQWGIPTPSLNHDSAKIWGVCVRTHAGWSPANFSKRKITCVFARSNAYLARRKRLPPEARNRCVLRFGRPAWVFMQDPYAFLLNTYARVRLVTRS